VFNYKKSSYTQCFFNFLTQIFAVVIDKNVTYEITMNFLFKYIFTVLNSDEKSKQIFQEFVLFCFCFITRPTWWIYL